jgi:Tfp pilus assembly protein PilE
MRSDRRVPVSVRRQQRGLTLISLLIVGVIVGTVAYVVMLVTPTVNEYITIQRTVDKIAASSPSTITEVREAFEQQKTIDFSITSISGRDLQITKQGDRLVIAFAYEKELALAGPAYLLLKYQGRSK